MNNINLGENTLYVQHCYSVGCEGGVNETRNYGILADRVRKAVRQKYKKAWDENDDIQSDYDTALRKWKERHSLKMVPPPIPPRSNPKYDADAAIREAKALNNWGVGRRSFRNSESKTSSKTARSWVLEKAIRAMKDNIEEANSYRNFKDLHRYERALSTLRSGDANAIANNKDANDYLTMYEELFRDFHH